MSKELEKDIEKLKKDMSRFRDDISSTMSDVGSFSHEKVLQTRQNLKKAIEGFEGMAVEKMHQANEVIHDQGEKLIKGSREAITKRPITTVAVSFAAGLLTAFLLEKKKHE